jgi:hypothetical protein
MNGPVNHLPNSTSVVDGYIIHKRQGGQVRKSADQLRKLILAAGQGDNDPRLALVVVNCVEEFYPHLLELPVADGIEYEEAVERELTRMFPYSGHHDWAASKDSFGIGRMRVSHALRQRWQQITGKKRLGGQVQKVGPARPRNAPVDGWWITTRIDVEPEKAREIFDWFQSLYGSQGYDIKFQPLPYGFDLRASLYIPNEYSDDNQVPYLINAIAQEFGTSSVSR